MFVIEAEAEGKESKTANFFFLVEGDEQKVQIEEGEPQISLHALEGYSRPCSTQVKAWPWGQGPSSVGAEELKGLLVFELSSYLLLLSLVSMYSVLLGEVSEDFFFLIM